MFLVITANSGVHFEVQFEELLWLHVEKTPVSKTFLWCISKQRGRGASLIAANGAIGEEQRVMSAAAPTDAERFPVPVSLINMGGTDMEMGDTTPIGQKVSEACSMLKVEEPHVFLLTSGFCTDFFFGVSHTASNFLRIQRLRFKLNGSLQDKVQSSPVSNWIFGWNGLSCDSFYCWCMQRKREALQMDTKTAAAVDEKEVLWRVNYEEFIRRLRHQVKKYQSSISNWPTLSGVHHRLLLFTNNDLDYGNVWMS